ncbi:ankyrin repeat domain-containing protein [Flavobacterium caeni]|nr:ankyrin repeat domain-containing protein [Flavobacterium caeni]
MMQHFILFLSVACCQALVAQNTADVFDIARKGTINQAKAVLTENPNAFDAINADGYSALILASYRGNNPMAKFLVDNGCDINYMSGMGTALMAAVAKNNLEVIEYLLDHKADPNLADGNGTTALIYAATFKNHQAATLLVKAGANATTKDKRGNSATDYAILADDDQLIQILKTK